MNRTDRQRHRLRQLVREAGSNVALAAKVDTAEQYISQLLNSRPGISGEFCERLEVAMGKPNGWMDQWLPEERVSEDLEVELLRLFRELDDISDQRSYVAAMRIEVERRALKLADKESGIAC